eukprot:4164303-Prorocentrum_lima.AAC.1
MLACEYLVHVSMMCCQGSLPDCTGGMSALFAGRYGKYKDASEACESTKSRSCCTTRLNAVVRRA